MVAFVAVTLWATSALWTRALALSLTCEADPAPSDAILVENLEPDYLLFERARQLRQAGLAPRVLVPVRTDPGTSDLNAVASGVVHVMADISRIGPVELVPVREVEPITLNVVRDVQRFIEREHIRSVIVVAPLFRSRRTELVYGGTLGGAGIAVRCDPVPGSRGPGDWTKSWHGIEDVVQQYAKLQYYRLYVLPFRLHRDR